MTETMRPSDIRAAAKALRRAERSPGRGEGVIGARQVILQAVNARRKIGPLNMRQIQLAVHIARKFHLVPDDIIVAAGYRARG